MKTVLVALNSQKILEQIKKTGKYVVHSQDITFKEGVLEFLSKNIIDVIITKDDLEGDMTREIYIKQMKMISPTSKVILFTEKLDENYKGFLLANGIFNIIKSKQIISIYGTSGSGKSYITSLIGQILSRKLKLNTILVDMDIQNPALDIYNNISGDINTLYYVMEDVDKDCFNSNSLKELIKKEKENRNLSFLTNNLDMYECQNRISPCYYNALYKEAVDNFDIVILDMPSSPFLDVTPFSLTKSDKIFFVVNPNFISVRQAHKYLDLLVNIWNIDKSKIFIILNKITRNSLSKKQVESMMKGYRIVMYVETSDNVEHIINGIQKITVPKDQQFSDLIQLFDPEVKMEEETIGVYKKIIGAFQ
jgi:MinD-like ATPase involved in chromosome partitioning or flagellar assembly